MSHRILILNTFIVALGLPFLVAAWLLPFSFFVDIKWMDYKDVCEGETIQTVFALRDVRWADSYSAHVNQELVRYEDNLVMETVIKRDTDFIYQKSDDVVIYEIEWSHPLPAGHYGINSEVTLEAIFPKKSFRGHETQQFTVYDCQY